MLYFDEYSAKSGVKLYPKQQEIIDEFYRGGYRELIAVLGRRSGKDLISIVIALKELEYLLSLKNPFKYYKLAEGKPIYIMLISTSSDQARVWYEEIKSIVTTSELLKHRLAQNPINRISFLTDADIQLKKELNTRGQKSAASKIKGSVVIMCASYNSEDILGKRIFTLIVNEVASFTGTSGDRIYSTLGPATADFRKNDILESKIITISCSCLEGNLLHTMYTCSKDVPRRLSVKHPTWEINPIMTKEVLENEFKFMSDDEFRMEFGAEFLPDDGNKTLSMRLPSTTINKLKQMAREKAFKSDSDVSYTDIIRLAIDNYIQKAKNE